MTKSKKYYPASMLLVFVWPILLPRMTSAQDPNQARIDTLNRDINKLKAWVEYWKPKFESGYPAWIFVPLTEGYRLVKKNVTSAAEAETATSGLKKERWVKDTDGTYGVDWDLFDYREKFRKEYADQGQEWIDRHWQNLVSTAMISRNSYGMRSGKQRKG